MPQGVAVYCDLSVDDIAHALRSSFPEKDVRIATEEDGAKSENATPEIVVASLDMTADDKFSMEKLNIKLDTKERELKNSEEQSAKALYTIQTLHKQQQALYDEFVLLRQRYDEQKNTLVTILWTHCAKYHPDLRQVPEAKDNKEYIENDSQV